MPRGRPKGGSMSQQVNEIVKMNVLNKNDLRSLVPKPTTDKIQPMLSSLGTATTEVIKQKDDHLYYNVLISNNSSTKPIDAKFIEVRGQPLLKTPEEWEMSVVRFKLPTQIIPIFIAQVSPPLTNNTVYSITLNNGAINSPQTFVQFVPDAFGSTPTNDDTHYYVYTYQSFLDMINTAITNAFNDPVFNASLPITGVAWSAPYLIYDPTTQLISLIAQQQYATNNIKLFMNTVLFNFFDPFRIVFYGYDMPLGKDFEIVIKNDFNNSITIPVGSAGAGTAGYRMTQETSSLARWNSFSKFVFMTGSVPIRPENINTTKEDTLSISAGQQSSVNTNFQPILTDFVPILNPNVRNDVIYYPTAEYRMTDLIGNSPLNIFDLQIFWEDYKQILRPLKIPYNGSCNVKFLFRKKKNK